MHKLVTLEKRDGLVHCLYEKNSEKVSIREQKIQKNDKHFCYSTKKKNDAFLPS